MNVDRNEKQNCRKMWINLETFDTAEFFNAILSVFLLTLAIVSQR